MNSKRSIISFILAAEMILFCSCEGDPALPADAVTDNTPTAVTATVSDGVTDSETTRAPSTSAGEASAPLEVEKMELLDRLALCITEGGVATDRASIFRRFAECKELGVQCVRVDTYWSSPYSGCWEMSEVTKNHLEAAKEYGLLLKLILPTIMAPPAWLSAEEGARLIDYNGRKSVNTVSYWYDGITDYTDMALRCMLDAVIESGYSDVIGGIVVDMGPAGEPLYPPEWTQTEQNSEEVMWCYGDNAQADFRDRMREKYTSIDAANSAWNSSYADFASISVPKPGEAKGRLWEDVLTWYRDTKRQFMSAQVDIFKAALADYDLLDRPLILYLPGADYTEQQWAYAIETGSAIANIKIGCDNNFCVDLAAEKGCLLQYTGITGQQNLQLLRAYMYEKGYGDIPVFGENAGGDGADLELLRDIIIQYKLYGIDYTHCHYLYEADGITPGARFALFGSVLDELGKFLQEVDLSLPPQNAAVEEAMPEGDILCFDIDFNLPESESLGYIFLTFATPGIELRYGDTLEYDLLLSEDFQGIGSIDGMIDGKTMRDGFGMTDTNGVRVHPNADHSDNAYPNWYHRIIEIGNTASDGGVLTELQLAAHPEKQDGNFSHVSVKVYYDNIVIRRDGEVIAEIFRNKGDCKLHSASLLHNASGSASVVRLDDIE